MNKTIGLILTLVITFDILTGCGVTTEEIAKKDDSSEKITLTMVVTGTSTSSDDDFILNILPKKVHEEFPNITLETTKLPDEQYYTYLKTKLAAGEAPDIFAVWPKNGVASAIDLRKDGYLMDLSEMKFWDKFTKAAKEDLSYNGKPVAVAIGLDMLGTYYNKELFKEAGVTDEPKDWSSFLSVCEKLKTLGITPIVMGDKDPWVIQFGVYQIAANKVYPEDMEFDKKLQAGQETFENSKWVDVMNMYKDLYDKGYIVKNSLGLSELQAAQEFVDGKAAMIIDGTWDYDSVTAKGTVDFERGYMPLPANNPGEPTFVSAATSSGYAINAKTKYPEQVKQIFELMFDGKSDLFKAWKASNNGISVFKGLPLNHELNKELYDTYQKGNSIYFCNQMWPGGVADEIESKFAEIIGGQATTPKDVTKAMDVKFKVYWKN